VLGLTCDSTSMKTAKTRTAEASKLKIDKQESLPPMLVYEYWCALNSRGRTDATEPERKIS